MEDQNYKKKYETALENIRRIKNANRSNDELVEFINFNYPELDESKDESNNEMIRKDIIDYLKGFIPHHDDYLVAMSKVWIDWLEKQDPKKHEEELEIAYKCADEVQYQRGYEDAKRKFKKNKVEPNPTEDNCKISDWDIKVGTIEYNNGYECGKQRVLKYPEDYGLCKKTAWSEEDEKIRKSLIGHLKECRNNTRSEVMVGEYANWISWLKFLKERVKGE